MVDKTRDVKTTYLLKDLFSRILGLKKVYTLVTLSFLGFGALVGQQTNSTPEKTSIPQGSSMAKLRSFMDLSAQALSAVLFHCETNKVLFIGVFSNKQLPLLMNNIPSSNNSRIQGNAYCVIPLK